MNDTMSMMANHRTIAVISLCCVFGHSKEPKTFLFLFQWSVVNQSLWTGHDDRRGMTLDTVQQFPQHTPSIFTILIV